MIYQKEPSPRDRRFLNLALKISNTSPHRFRMAAIVVKGNRIMSVGTNKYKTHPRQINPHTGESGSSVHAELDAIIGLPKESLKGATIYVARQTIDGNPAIAKPCKCCQKVIEVSGIIRVFYT